MSASITVLSTICRIEESTYIEIFFIRIMEKVKKRRIKGKVEYREAEIMCSTCNVKPGQFGVEANARLEAMICLCTNCGKVTMARDKVDLLFDSQLFAAQGPKMREPTRRHA